MAARAGAAAGVAGPVAFTGAWILSSLRQTGYRAADLQISGLAAPDARDPWIMITGFLVLGGCSVAFGAALHDALNGHGHAGLAPRLIQGVGILTIAVHSSNTFMGRVDYNAEPLMCFLRTAFGEYAD